FFFSSRRRHTRFSRDWSSDVCSSDLGHQRGPRPGHGEAEQRRGPDPEREGGRRRGGPAPGGAGLDGGRGLRQGGLTTPGRRGQQAGTLSPFSRETRASTAPSRVVTGISRRPRGSSARASAHSAFGTRNTVAPSRRAAWVFRGTPPTGPTLPSASMVPVPATTRPPVRSPPSPSPF